MSFFVFLLYNQDKNDLFKIDSFFKTSCYSPRGLHEVFEGGGDVDSPLSIAVLKRKSNKKNFGGFIFSRVDFSLEGSGTLAKNSYKPSQDL